MHSHQRLEPGEWAALPVSSHQSESFGWELLLLLFLQFGLVVLPICIQLMSNEQLYHDVCSITQTSAWWGGPLAATGCDNRRRAHCTALLEGRLARRSPKHGGVKIGRLVGTADVDSDVCDRLARRSRGQRGLAKHRVNRQQERTRDTDIPNAAQSRAADARTLHDVSTAPAGRPHHAPDIEATVERGDFVGELLSSSSSWQPLSIDGPCRTGRRARLWLAACSR